MPNAVAQPAPNTAASPQSAVAEPRCPRTAVHHEFGPPFGPGDELAGRHGPNGTGPWLAGTRYSGSRHRAVSRQPAAGLLPFAGVVRSLDADRTHQGLAFRSGHRRLREQRHRSYSGRRRHARRLQPVGDCLGSRAGGSADRQSIGGPRFHPGDGPGSQRRPKFSGRRAERVRWCRASARGRPKSGQDSRTRQ